MAPGHLAEEAQLSNAFPPTRACVLGFVTSLVAYTAVPWPCISCALCRESLENTLLTSPGSFCHHSVEHLCPVMCLQW